LNPRTREPEASMRTTRPPKPSYDDESTINIETKKNDIEISWTYPSWCVSIAQFGMRISLILMPNSATDTHQLGRSNICGHTTKLTTPMYFNLLF
jgi:hypothetical protein